MLKRCLIVAALSFVVDLALSAYVVAMQNHLWVVACVATLTIPFGNFVYNLWWVDSSSARDRIWLTAANAAGALAAQGVIIPVAIWVEG